MSDTNLSEAVAQAKANLDAHTRETVQWHFSPETGCPFWLEKVKGFDFDPLTDVADYPDLARFPDIGHHLRNRSVDDLTPRGLSETPEVFETGGTTGSPKRLIYSREWVDRCLSWKVAERRHGAARASSRRSANAAGAPFGLLEIRQESCSGSCSGSCSARCAGRPYLGQLTSSSR